MRNSVGADGVGEQHRRLVAVVHDVLQVRDDLARQAAVAGPGQDALEAERR
ncbi:hypothetical protein [Streptomyces sp. NPDC047071]|uniref:hypothetical protein n=1 Tax=Streptomyces sp. NPDC047071 TaxID=3154808 RepID=UPI0034522E6D